MKNMILTISSALILSAGLTVGYCVPSAEAASPQLWRGHGVVHGRKGRAVARYRLELAVTRTATNRVRRDVRVYLPGGRVEKMSCTAVEKGRGWTVNCGKVRGGGACFGDGLCLDYVSDGKGRAFATTIVIDGKRTMRLLRTELLRGKAQRFYRERLTRQK